MHNKVILIALLRLHVVLQLGIICTVSLAAQILANTKTAPCIITRDEEMMQKSIGPLNKYELLNSYPTIFSTRQERTNENLIQIYDSNLYIEDVSCNT